jgi:hypothetical protein
VTRVPGRSLRVITLLAAAGAAAALAGLHSPAHAVAAATPSPSPAASPSPAPSASPSSPSPSPALNGLTGEGSWDVNGALVKLGGAIAGSVDTNGNTFTFGVAGKRGSWTSKFGIQGNAPVTVTGTVKGPGPVVDATVWTFGFPVTVQGTPGSDLSVRLGPSPKRAGLQDNIRLVAAARPLAAGETPEQTLIRVGEDWLRAVVAYTILGWLAILIAPGLKDRAVAATRSMPLSRLGVGAILALDIPLASLVVLVVGLPLGLWWLGLLGLFLFLVLWLVSFAYAGLLLARLVFDRSGLERVSSFVVLPAGVAALCLIGLIPYVGSFLSLIAAVFGMGALLYAPRRVAARLAAEAGEELVPAPEERAAAAGRPVVE